MTFYISGKITGEANWKGKFRFARTQLEKQGYKVLSPDMIDVDLDYEQYMVIDFAMIDASDAVFFLEDWEQSPGAKREKAYAQAKQKELWFQCDLG